MSLSRFSLDEFYDDYPRIEEAFKEALDESLNPRGSAMLYDIVAELSLPPGSTVVDLGCGDGKHSIELARRFGFAVRGIDPVPRHIELANRELDGAANEDPELGRRVTFGRGKAEALPLADGTVDLIWCREVLYHIAPLDQAFAECRRVLRPGGHMLICQAFATERLEQREAERMWSVLGIVAANTDPGHVEAAFTGAGHRLEECVEPASEWGEYAEERSGQVGRHLLHAARLLRDPERYIALYGRSNYGIKLGDCLWHVYRMIGKLSTRVYLLRRE